MIATQRQETWPLGNYRGRSRFDRIGNGLGPTEIEVAIADVNDS